MLQLSALMVLIISLDFLKMVLADVDHSKYIYTIVKMKKFKFIFDPAIYLIFINCKLVLTNFKINISDNLVKIKTILCYVNL